jgi:hypothetical protein
MRKILNLFIAFILMTTCQAQKERLELNLSKGEIYTQKMNCNDSIIQTINDEEVNTLMSINGKMTYKVIDILNDVYNMEVRYESLTMKISVAGAEMEFSSDKNDEKDILSTILGTMKNKPFLVKMTKTGKVNEVKNIEVIFHNMFDKFPQLSEEQKEQISGQMLKAYGEKAFKGNIEMCSAIFPDSPISKGEKWKIKTQLESGMSAKLETVYELKEIGDSSYQILGNSKMETADKDAYIETAGMPLKFDMSGSMTSDIKIDKKTGWTIYAKINQVIKGTAYIKANPKMPEGLVMPMIMKNEMIISEK